MRTSRDSLVSGRSLSRRTFLGRSAAASLAVAALPSVAFAAPETPAEEGVFRAAEINHLALDTPDEPAAIAFFEQQLGMTKLSHGRMVRDTFLHFAKGFLNTGVAQTAALNHFCLGIEDFTPDGVYRVLDALNLSPQRLGGGNLLHVRDPDGLNIQIQEQAHGYGRTPADQLTNAGKGLLDSLYWDHVTLHVTDISRSRDFYTWLFGMKAETDEKGDRCVLRLKQGYVELLKRDKPGLDHFCVAVKQLDPAAASEKLKGMKVPVEKGDGEGVLRLTDPNGFQVEVVAAEAKA